MPVERIATALARSAPPVLPSPEVPRRASVAVVVYPAPGQPWPELLMIRRSDKAGDPWSGHMAFPGGRADPQDPDLLHTAMRESQEELGLDLRGAQVLGSLDAMHTPTFRTSPQLAVQPWVFALPALPPLRPNGEVASVHTFNLGRLLAREGRGEFPYTWQGQALQLPCVTLDGCFIWGLSLRVIDDLIERLEAEGR